MTTTTVSLDGLRELSGFRAEHGCAISLYLDLDPSVAPTAGDAADARALAARRRGEVRTARVARASRTRSRPGLKADFERLEQYFDERVRPRRRARARRLRRRARQRLERAPACPGPFADTARVADDFLLAPLVPLLGRGDGALVAVVGRERGRVLALRARPAGGDRRPHRGDAGPARPGRLVAGALPAPSRQPRPRALQGRSPTSSSSSSAGSAGPASSSSAARRRARSSPRRSPSEVAEAIIGWTNAEAHASDAELYDGRVTPGSRSGARRARARRSSAGARRRAKGARGAAGWEDTLEAASDGRVELLLHQHGRAARTPTAAPRAGAPRSTRRRARWTGRRWSCATTVSTSPSG